MKYSYFLFLFVKLKYTLITSEVACGSHVSACPGLPPRLQDPSTPPPLPLLLATWLAGARKPLNFRLNLWFNSPLKRYKILQTQVSSTIPYILS